MKSERRTTVAVIRAGIEMAVEEFGAVIGKSVPTIRALESGKLKLSEKTGLEIAKKTGVSVGWLLAGDPTTPPTDVEGRPWSRDTFLRQSAKELGLQLIQGHGQPETQIKAWVRAYARAVEYLLLYYGSKGEFGRDAAAILMVHFERHLRDQWPVTQELSSFDEAFHKTRSPRKSAAPPSPENARPKGGSKSA